MPGDDQANLAVRHDHMAALPGDAVAEFREYADRVLLADPGKLWRYG